MLSAIVTAAWPLASGQKCISTWPLPTLSTVYNVAPVAPSRTWPFVRSVRSTIRTLPLSVEFSVMVVWMVAGLLPMVVSSGASSSVPDCCSR